MICAGLLLLPAQAQEKYLAAADDGTLSLYDLATNTLIETIKGTPYTYTVAAGPNARLAFAAGGIGGTVADTTIGRATRLTGVPGAASTVTPDGKLYLVSGFDDSLNVVDTATLKVVRKVDLKSVISYSGLAGAVVATANKAYILPRYSVDKF
jgi:YVTN family beta-propeller protein